MNNKKTGLIIALILFITMLLVSGGTFAYFQWQSLSVNQTNVIVSVTDNIEMRIDPAEVTKTGLRPTNNCAGEFAMSGNSLVTIDNNTGVLARPRFKLKLKITDKEGNNITNEASPMGSPYRQYIKYVVTEQNGDCTSPLSSGRFNLNTETSAGSGWYESSTLTLNDADGFPALSDGANTGVSFDAFANRVTKHTYKVWIWIDETYTAVSTGNNVTVDKLQNAMITVSWSENSSVEQVHSDGVASVPELTGEAYAVYSAFDKSLRFYRSDTPITVGSTYNGHSVTAVYTGFEEESYSQSEIPWFDYRQNITNVIFENEIMPISTAYWFNDFSRCPSINITKLNTSYVSDMTYMFRMAGNSTTTFSIIGLESLDTSRVINMKGMFMNLFDSQIAELSWDLSSWNVSNVENMSQMFDGAGYNATTFFLNLSGWNTGKVTDMSRMFASAGYNATISFSILGLENLNTQSVTNMNSMFSYTGKNVSYSFDLSGWNVCNVSDRSTFKNQVSSKIIAPNWGMECPTT